MTTKEIYDFTGKVALITGGASGIGRAIAEIFSGAGAKVAIIDISDDVEITAREIAGDNAIGIKADLTLTQSVTPLVEKVIEHFGQIDILVNNAGIAILEPAEGVSEAAWDKTMSINLKAPFLLSQAVGKYMLAAGCGKIINLASQAGVVALPNHMAYCISKAGIISMTKVLALEWSGKGVQINSISPTVVLTELGRKAWSGQVGADLKKKIPAGRFAYPEEIAYAVMFLASEGANMITGENLVVDGGYTIQ